MSQAIIQNPLLQKVFSQIKNIVSKPHPALNVKGKRFLIGSDESYMPEKLLEYKGQFPAFQYSPKKGLESDQEEFAKFLDEFIKQELKHFGAVIIKGAPIQNKNDFAKIMAKADFGQEPYIGGTTFRSQEEEKEGTRVYTPTLENPGITMECHVDSPFEYNQPTNLAFFYQEPASDGVNLMINNNEYFESLDKSVVDEFIGRKVRYDHYYSSEDNNNRFVSWQESFGNDKKQVEKFLEENNYEYEWVNNGKDLRKWEIIDALKSHPQTGAKVFSQSISAYHASYFHSHFLFPELEGVHFDDPNKFKGTGILDYPHNTKYGDGGEIPYDIIRYLRDKLWNQTVGIMPEKGDLVLVDNYICSHGRLGYTPPRQAYISTQYRDI